MSQVEDDVIRAFREKIVARSEIPDGLVEPLIEAVMSGKKKPDAIVQIINSTTRPEVQ